MTERKLLFSVTLDDCETQVFRAGGNGGQKQNKTSSGVRIIHHPSGARGESREQRSQLQNKKAAFRRMAESAPFKVWLNKMMATGPSPEERVRRDLDPRNLVVEGKEAGRWVAVSG